MNEDSFYSIDRLVEFGMGLAVARQMVNTMNETMRNMYIPGTMNTMQPAQSQIYYVIIDNQQVGPLSETDLSRLIAEHSVTKDTFVWCPGMVGWQTMEKVPSVLRLVAMTPPPFNLV